MQKTEGVRKLWNRYKYAVLVVLLGAGLLLWPNGNNNIEENAAVKTDWESRDIQTEMEEILGTISGVGQVRVMLTMDSDGERQLAQNTELIYSGDTAAPEDYSRRLETVLVDGETGDEVIVTKTRYPSYRGALVVCAGGEKAEVRLAVTEAVAALTGLPTDRITVAKWQ